MEKLPRPWVLVAGVALLAGCGPRRITPDEMRADLDVLFQKIEQVHLDPHAYVPAEQFNVRRHELYRQVDRPMTVGEFYRLAAPVVASLKSGHTFLYPPERAYRMHLELDGGLYPLALEIRDGDVRLADALGAGLPVGGQVLTINDEDAGAVIARLARCFPGERRAANPAMLQDAHVLQRALWLEYGGEAPLRLRVRGPKGDVADHVLPAMTRRAFRAALERRGTELRMLDYSCRHIEELKTAVIRVDAFAQPHWYRRFLAVTLRQLRDKKTEHVVLDLRRNRGGWVSLAEVLLECLTDRPFRLYETVRYRSADGSVRELHPREIQPAKDLPRFTGDLYVLIGPGTSSAGVALAAAVKHYRLGTLIGRPTGGRRSLYGGSRRFLLPNSRLRLSVASNFAVVVGGDGEAVVPHLHAVQHPRDTATGTDTVLQHALSLIRGGNGR